MNRVTVVDYGVSNIDSVRRSFEECGATVRVSDRPEDLESADRIVLPGVGAFPAGMRNLRERGLDECLQREATAGAPLLGICLGMQLLATRGAEAGGDDGLDLIAGTVERLEPTDTERRIPHVGWNAVVPNNDSLLFAGIPAGTDFYFVHSFRLRSHEPGDVLATTPYGAGFASAVARDNVFGVQFHPEKSQAAGFALIHNFLSI